MRGASKCSSRRSTTAATTWSSEANGIVRHVHLKSSFEGSTIDHVKANILLADKQSGCIVFMRFDPKILALGPFYFFGGKPGEKLPNIAGMRVGKHTKGNAQGVKAERPHIRVIPLSRFERLTSIEQVVVKLFGSPSADTQSEIS